MLCSSAQCSHACVVVLALVPGYKFLWVWEKLPFPAFLGRFASRQVVEGGGGGGRRLAFGLTDVCSAGGM